jgi:hypothetical protein
LLLSQIKDESRSTVSMVQTLTLLDLPVDIFYQILYYFKDVGQDKNGSFGQDHVWRKEENIVRQQSIRNLRLVCRRLCELASPLLFPILKVSINSKSLSIAEAISQSPWIRQGVRSVHVFLDYYPAQLAEDIAAFADFRRNQLRELSRQCDYYAETWALGGYDPDDETICPLPKRVYDSAMVNYWSISAAWREYVDPECKDEINKKQKEYQEILQQGFDEFGLRHLDQQQLIMSGDFVRRLAACIARMPNAHSLAFYDDRNRMRLDDNPTTILNDKERLRGLMIMPVAWGLFENWGYKGAEILPAKIFSDLPIGIHKAGGILQQLVIGCFPLFGDYSVLTPHLEGAGWADLGTAFEHLTVFEIGKGSMNHLPIRHDYLDAEVQRRITNYLGAALSSTNLEVVEINLYVLGIHEGTKNGRKGNSRIGPSLSDVRWPRIRRLRLLRVESNQEDLESFCHGLGDSLEDVYLSGVTLQNGSWATILDILREKVAKRCSEGRCRLIFNDLDGGGLVAKDPQINESIWDDLLGKNLGDFDFEEPQNIVEAQKYVCDDGVSENPLRMKITRQ